MHLKEIELSGFKSFAKKTALSFGTPISAIVGPNGSGKSNVAEAFRFVLGEQSMKSMRGKRTEDLIFNGSSSASRANRASVSMTFDNAQKSGKRLLPIDFDTVTITRTIHRDASSEYAINGTAVRLKDIMELLSSAHIGASGHHIISQGEADRVLSVNSRERKAMIEDALGLKTFQYKKEESLRKLEKTRDNMAQVEGLRKEIRPHLKFLASQVEKVKKALEQAKELSVRYREYFRREKFYLSRERARLEGERAPLLAQKGDIEKDLTSAEHTLQSEHADDTAAKKLTTLHDTLTKAREETERLTRELGRVEGMVALEEKRQIRRKESAALPVPAHDVRDFLDALESWLANADRAADMQAIHILIGTFRDALNSFRARVDSGVHDKTEDAAFAELLKEKEILAGTRQNAQQAEEQARREYDACIADREKEKEKGREAERTVFTLTARKNEISMKLQMVAQALERLELEENTFKVELTEAALLAGRESVDFEGEELDEKGALTEPRAEQEVRRRIIEKLKLRIEDAGASGSDEVMREYESVRERDEFLERELADLATSAESLESLIADLETQLADMFTDGLGKINAQFAEFFALMFGGGMAALSLVRERKRRVRDEFTDEGSENEEDASTEEGIEIKVSLPRKKIRGLDMLSGGERALTSIALIFAMSQVNPPPFLILDETDAALDEANSRRYGDMIETLAKHSQLILITHNRETMSRAGVLYGVTMGSDAVSQIISVAFDEAVRVAK